MKMYRVCFEEKQVYAVFVQAENKLAAQVNASLAFHGGEKELVVSSVTITEVKELA